MSGAPLRSRGAPLRSRGAALVAVAAAVALPFVLRDYQIFQATMVVVYAVALVGLNLLTGHNGQISLGHGAFYALGAYVTAILMEHAGWPYWAALPVAAAAGAACGWAFGLPALKLEPLYLALATFALGVVTPQLLKVRALERWTGGNGGLVLAKPDAPAGLPLNADQWLYLFALVVALVLYRLAHNLVDGGVGRALHAVRDHPIAAAAMGIDVARTKTAAFALSALYTSVAGGLGAIAVQYVAPESFGAFLSISLLVGAVVGGVSSLSGAWWGALFIQFVPTAAEKLSKSAPWAMYGVVLLAVMFLVPDGIAGGLARLRARIAARKAPFVDPSPSP